MNKLSMSRLALLKIEAFINKVPAEQRKATYQAWHLSITQIIYDKTRLSEKSDPLFDTDQEVIKIGEGLIAFSQSGYCYLDGKVNGGYIQIHPGDKFNQDGTKDVPNDSYYQAVCLNSDPKTSKTLPLPPDRTLTYYEAIYEYRKQRKRIKQAKEESLMKELFGQ